MNFLKGWEILENNDLRYVKSLISKIDKRSGTDQIRLSLYSIITVILLSKEVFKKNIDIVPFIDSLNLNYKEYIFKSRTLLVARVIRYIEKAEHEDLLLFIEVCKQLMFPDLDKKISVPNKKAGNIDDLLNQFKRGSR